MVNWKRIPIVMLAVLLLTGSVHAAELQQEQAEIFGADRLEKGLSGDAEEIMDNYDPMEQADFGEGLTAIFTEAVRNSEDTLRASLRSVLRVLVIVLLCQLITPVASEQAAYVVTLAGVLAVMASCVADVHTMIGLGQNAMNEISSFTGLLMPVMAAACAASGGTASASAIYAAATFFSDVLVRISSVVLIPVIYAYLAAAVADAAMQQERLKRLRELLGWLFQGALRTAMYLFTGFLSVTGILSGQTDAVALKAAKLTISNMVPVVGGIISDAANTVLSGASLLKSSIGTFGMLAILAIFCFPFLRLGLSYLLFKLISALGGMLGSRLVGLLDAVTSAMGYLMAMIGSCAWVSFLSCCCFLRVVQP